MPSAPNSGIGAICRGIHAAAAAVPVGEAVLGRHLVDVVELEQVPAAGADVVHLDLRVVEDLVLEAQVPGQGSG